MRCVDRLRFVCLGGGAHRLCQDGSLLRYGALALAAVAVFLVLVLGTGPVLARLVTPRFDPAANCTVKAACHCGPDHWKWANATPNSWSQFGGCVLFGFLLQFVPLFAIAVVVLVAWGVGHWLTALCAEWRRSPETRLVNWNDLDDEEEHHSL